MRKKVIAILLAMCMIIGTFPLQSFDYPGDIWHPKDEQATTHIYNNGKTLVLQNDYISAAFYDVSYGTYIATVPTAVAKESQEVYTTDVQYPSCAFYTMSGGEPNYHYVALSLDKAEFVSSTPNGKNAILLVWN